MFLGMPDKIQFFTIVRNGMPFIRHHWNVFSRLSCNWHWHIVEGAADLKNDTAWSLPNGGRLPEEVTKTSLSTDGTADYIDELFSKYPTRVTVYRKPQGQLWEGKLEMIKAPLATITEECLLWQIDVDEFWTSQQIEAIYESFIRNSSKTAAWYWCNFYVGPEAVVSTRNCYSQNPQQEWLRTWNFKPGDRWVSHEPPTLVRKLDNGTDDDVGKINPFLHDETESLGAVFDHHAYVQESQLVFKEEYYGYKGALEGWNDLQKELNDGSPVLLTKYFSWVNDSTYVQCSKKDNPLNCNDIPPMVLIDGIAFQDPWNPGICRVWKSILEYWVSCGWGKYVSVLDRGGTMPEIPGINRIPFHRWESEGPASDSLKLEQVCRDTRSAVFISTLYTMPARVPSVMLVHDFIPERLGVSTESPGALGKKLALSHSSQAVCVSENTRNDLLEYFPDVDPNKVKVAHLGVSSALYPRSPEVVEEFKRKHHIKKPYFLLVGERVGLLGEVPPARGYKNASLLFEAFSIWKRSSDYDLLIVGGSEELEKELRETAPMVLPIMIKASDDDLPTAYSGALALVYSSKYEGFGLPVAEAMKCGCPVITSNTSSLPEVGGGAPIYIDPDDVHSLIRAMEQVLRPYVRGGMVELGLVESQRFHWEKLALALQVAVKQASREGVREPELWYQLTKTLAQHESDISRIKRHEEEIKSIKASLSWRCTALLRLLDGFLRKILNIIRI